MLDWGHPRFKEAPDIADFTFAAAYLECAAPFKKNPIFRIDRHLQDTVITIKTIQAGSALLLPLFSFPIFFVFSAFPSAGSEGTKNRVP